MPVETDYKNAGSNISNYSFPGADKTKKSSQDNKSSQTNQTNEAGEVIDAVFADPNDQKVSVDDFLQLMIAQLKNQDFMNPVDDTQYVTQLAQFTTMQQMEEMAYNSKSTFITSLVGKTVVASKMTVSGSLDTTEGIVDKISLVDSEYLVYINNKSYKMDEIMQVKTNPVQAPEENKPTDNEGSGGDDGDGGNDGNDPEEL